MAHSQEYRERDVPLSVYEAHHFQHRAPPVERSGRVDPIDFSGIGGHLLPELNECPGTYPNNLEISTESTGDESTAQPYRYSRSPITPIAPPPTRSATPEPPTTPREYTAISMPIRAPPRRCNRLGNAERYSDASTYADTPLGSTFSRRHRSYPPSRTTLNGSQEDVGNFADVEDNSERAPTIYQPSHTTPSHHSIGTREDVDTEVYDHYPDQSPQSELPYNGVWSYSMDRARHAVEDYERHHGHRR